MENNEYSNLTEAEMNTGIAHFKNMIAYYSSVSNYEMSRHYEACLYKMFLAYNALTTAK